MSDVATLLSEFLDQLNAGGAPEAAEFLDRAESDEQRTEVLHDASAPPRRRAA